jgi:hypothetical protein
VTACYIRFAVRPDPRRGTHRGVRHPPRGSTGTALLVRHGSGLHRPELRRHGPAPSPATGGSTIPPHPTSVSRLSCRLIHRRSLTSAWHHTRLLDARPVGSLSGRTEGRRLGKRIAVLYRCKRVVPEAARQSSAHDSGPGECPARQRVGDRRTTLVSQQPRRPS